METTIDEKIAALIAEETELGATIRQLEIEQREADSKLDALLAKAVRSGKASDKTAATAAEEALTKLAAELRRQRAALVACQSDLTAALAEQSKAQRQQVKADLLAAHAAYEALVLRLDEDVADLDVWAKLNEVATQGNRLYFSRALKPGQGMPIKLFSEPKEQRARILGALATRIDAAIGPAREAVKQMTAADAFETHRIKMLIVNDFGLS